MGTGWLIRKEGLAEVMALMRDPEGISFDHQTGATFGYGDSWIAGDGFHIWWNLMGHYSGLEQILEYVTGPERPGGVIVSRVSAQL